jgi:hypothetical protein
MKKINWLSSLRRHIAVTSAAFGAGGAWGGLAAYCSRTWFGLEEETALLFVFLAVSLAFIALVWRRLPRVLGFDE